jgi:undecaprenyl phosphate-alpha-L-ara4N flippase subunit ArnE
MRPAMNPLDVAMLLLFSLLLSGGQALFKKVALDLPQSGFATTLSALLLDWWFYAAVAIYAANTFLWVFILRRVPLSSAYPFVSLGFVVVPFAGWYFWNEQIRAGHVIGTALVLTGIAVMTFSTKSS